MTDPWTRFEAAAARAETAGYFERAPDRRGRGGYAAWFDRAERLPPIRGIDDLADVRRRIDRHLAGGPGRAAMGFFGFDAYSLFDPGLALPPTTGPFPIGEFLLPGSVHRSPPRAAVERPVSPPGQPAPPPRRDSLPARRFERAVERLQQEIRRGEAFQVVLAHRREWRRPDDLLRRAGRLRAAERFAYFYYLRAGDREIVGASPEAVVEVDGRRARVQPIAGTRPRPATAGRRPLYRDRKELAEHRMLVDLARNDLGRIAVPGSVRLPWRERRLRLARLEHLVSRVEARLAPGRTAWDALAATFPAGTVSGAPKLRATELLRREERTWRGPYAGAVGWLRRGGDADWALLIRSAFAAGPSLYTAAGAGIVYASEPRREYAETEAKLAVLEAAVAGPLR